MVFWCFVSEDDKGLHLASSSLSSLSPLGLNGGKADAKESSAANLLVANLKVSHHGSNFSDALTVGHRVKNRNGIQETIAGKDILR